MMVGQWVYASHDPNGPNDLEYQEIESPKLRSTNEVLLRIWAVSLNYRDVRILRVRRWREIMTKQGSYTTSTKSGRLVGCSDAAGEVEEAGEDVKMFR